MNPFSLVADRYLRLRHSYGFGVHSPYAFRLVKTILTPGRYGFYGYDDIEEAFNSFPATDTRQYRLSRVLLRFLATEPKRKVYISSVCHTAFRAAVKASSSRTLIVSGKSDIAGCDMVVASAADFSRDALESMLQSDGFSLFLTDCPADLARSLADALPCGIFFAGRHASLFLNRPHISKVGYTVRL